MRKKIVSLILIIAVAVATILAIKSVEGESLVTGSLSEVNSLKIYGDKMAYNSETREIEYKEFVYLDSIDKKEIESYFNALVSISAFVSKTEEDREHHPIVGNSYIIEISYNNGSKDTILTGEDPGYFFRDINEKGDWIGGSHYELGEMLKNLYYESSGAKRVE